MRRANVAGLAGRTCGPRTDRNVPLWRLAPLERENRRLRFYLGRAGAIIEIPPQDPVLLRIRGNRPDNDRTEGWWWA